MSQSNQDRASSRDDTSRALRVVVGLIFVSPLLLAGALPVYSLLSGEVAPANRLITIILAAGFLFIPALVVFKMWRRPRRSSSPPAKNDPAPWLNKAAWTEGRISSGSGGLLFFPWLFAFLFGGTGGATMVAAIGDISEEGWIPVALASIFVLCGVGMLYWAIYSTAHHFKYGRSEFQLETIPGVVGGWLRGTIVTRYHPNFDDRLLVRLSCIRRRVTGIGKNRSTKSSTEWQEEMELRAEDIRRGATGNTEIPIALWVPRECQPTTMDDPQDRHLWELEIEAETPGVDYHATFEVPVFVTEASSDVMPAEAAATYTVTDTHREEYRRASKIRITPLMDGAAEIYAPPARNKGMAASFTVVTVLWTAAVYFLIVQDAPIVFPVVFGLIDLILIYSVASLWFGTSRTVARRDGLEVTNRVLGLGGTHTIPADAIDAIDLQIGMQAGDKAYYRVYVRTQDRRKHDIATGIRDKREARWVIDTLQDALHNA